MTTTFQNNISAYLKRIGRPDLAQRVIEEGWDEARYLEEINK